MTYKTRVIGICYPCLFGLEWHWGVRVFQLPFLWRGRYLYFLQRLLLGACRNCFLPLNPGVLHLARCIWVLFEAFCAFFTAGCETPKWIAVANSPFLSRIFEYSTSFPRCSRSTRWPISWASVKRCRTSGSFELMYIFGFCSSSLTTTPEMVGSRGGIRLRLQGLQLAVLFRRLLSFRLGVI